MTELVIDASAGIEMIARTVTGSRLAASLAGRAWQLRQNVTFPDACYVALAEALNCPLLTADHRLAAAPTLPVSTLHL